MSFEHSPARTAKRAGAEVHDPSLTVDQFCRAENISRSMLYRAWAEGWGPKFYKIGVTRRHHQPCAAGMAACARNRGYLCVPRTPFVLIT